MATDKGVVFGTPLTESCIAQIYQLIEYLSKSKPTEQNPLILFILIFNTLHTRVFF